MVAGQWSSTQWPCHLVAKVRLDDAFSPSSHAPLFTGYSRLGLYKVSSDVSDLTAAESAFPRSDIEPDMKITVGILYCIYLIGAHQGVIQVCCGGITGHRPQCTEGKNNWHWDDSRGPAGSHMKRNDEKSDSFVSP